ncbi:hypothetical protein SAMN06297422_10458 [Lachnospiraceae bacterium]|nr:hypothetical protein SAMN06297422_10458 [Lachnospiraceae bacterium]
MEEKNNHNKNYKNGFSVINTIRVVVILAAMGLILMGLGNNGFNDIKNKAIRICYECIGIG